MKNIVIIIVDAFRPKNLSLFGYEKESDKNLKDIAKDSLFFKKHFSSSNATAPSLTSLFTGDYPNTHGIIHQLPYTSQEEIDNLNQNKFWLPSYLKQKGYDTIAIDWIGLWFKKGFDYYRDKKQEKPNPFLNYPLVRKLLLNLPSWAYSFGKKVFKARASPTFPTSAQTMDLGISQIKEPIKSKKPFFLFMHFWDTHFPFPTTKYKGSEKRDIDPIIEGIKDEAKKEYFKKRITDIGLHSIKDIVNKYDLAIKNIDQEIGRLHQFLKKQNLWEDTIFIVLGDHGTNLTEHKTYFSSSSLYEETIHVPLIIHLPGVEKKQINELVQNIDVVPTIFDYLNFKETPKFDGKSLLPLTKQERPIRNKILAFDGLAENIKAVRTKNKKLVISERPVCNICRSSHHNARMEEFDLIKDPEEKNNIYDYRTRSELENSFEIKNDK